jgi:hypothetical protein
MDQLEGFLTELNRLSNLADDAAQERRRQIWHELLPAFNRGERDGISFLAAELEVQPVTVRRWIAGKYSPRHVHLQRMKHLLGLRNVGAQMSKLGEKPDLPVPFENAFAAFRGVNHFFYALKFCRLAFVFKGRLSYHAGRPGSVREMTISVLETKSRGAEEGNIDPLILYYFYLQPAELAPSPAEESLRRFLRSPRVEASGIAARKLIRPMPIQSSNDRLGLSYSPVSPIVLIYDDAGRSKFDRFGDVLLETPVEFVQPDNSPIDYEASLRTVFVQLPETEALSFWRTTSNYLASLKNSDQSSQYADLAEEHLSIAEFGWM